MKEIKFIAYEDYESEKKKAEEYINRILFGISLFERQGFHAKPTVFMSEDVLNTIGRATEEVRMSYLTPTEKILTVCGCNIKIVASVNVLSIGFNLL